MADRRMIAKTIVDSDAFLSMPQSAQLLYFHLAIRADDDGFINKPKSIARLCGSKDEDIETLSANRFTIPFESGVVVIKHWYIHNYIQADRYKETVYTAEKSKLKIKPNKSYTLSNLSRSELDELVKRSETIIYDILQPFNPDKKKHGHNKHHHGSCKNVLLTDEEYEKILNDYGPIGTKEIIEKLSMYKASSGKSYKSDYQAIRLWVIKSLNLKPIEIVPNELLELAKKQESELNDE